MINLSAAVPPPQSVCDRAWERAFVLIEEYQSRLLDDRAATDAGIVLRSGPNRLTWDQIGSMRRLFGRLVERRT